ncbi:hypothetical protein [Streptomyces antimycoticus]|nr:hypothetical protein OG751_46770 [Streptomyces antimycoticus]
MHILRAVHQDMPQVAITLAEGRTPTQIRDLLHEVHAAQGDVWPP